MSEARKKTLERLTPSVHKCIEAVPVVRCKECEDYNTIGCSKGFGWCESLGLGVSDDFYCANGAKMESEVKP